jgi:hypothetical protein
MKLYRYSLIAMLLPGLPLWGQFGHWEGTVGPAGRESAVQIDLASVDGKLVGTISKPGEKLKGIPVKDITVEGGIIAFSAREDQPFVGKVAADGKSIVGEVMVEGHEIPVNLTRTGDASIERSVWSTGAGKELQGTWNGTVNGGVRVQLRLATRDGSVVNVDEGGLEIPVSAFTQTGSNVTLDLKAIGASYTGTLNREGTELAGTLREGDRSVPLTFLKASE